MTDTELIHLKFSMMAYSVTLLTTLPSVSAELWVAKPVIVSMVMMTYL